MQEFNTILFVSLIVLWLGLWLALWLYRRNKFIPFTDAIEMLADKTKWYEEVRWNNLISKEEYTREHLMRFVFRGLLNLYGRKAKNFEPDITPNKRCVKIPKEYLPSFYCERHPFCVFSGTWHAHSIKCKEYFYYDIGVKVKAFNNILNSPDLWIEPENKKERDFKHLLVTENEEVPEGFIGVRLLKSHQMFSGPFKVEGFMEVKMESSDGNV